MKRYAPSKSLFDGRENERGGGGRKEEEMLMLALYMPSH